MQTGRGPRRIASGVFVAALIALLVVPVGSASRPSQSHTTAGQTHTKAVAPAARSLQVAAFATLDHHLQLDPAALPDVPDPVSGDPVAAADTALSPAIAGAPFEPTVRGPPAL